MQTNAEKNSNESKLRINRVRINCVRPVRLFVFLAEIWDSIPRGAYQQAEARNDCLYRYMYRTKHIAFVDFDEFILPKGSLKTWPQLIKTLNQRIGDDLENICSYTFKTNHFITRDKETEVQTGSEMSVPLVAKNKNISHMVAKYDIKSLMYLTRDHFTRSGVNKVIVIPERVLVAGTHRVMLGLWNSWQHQVEPHIATNQHYRIPKVKVNQRITQHEWFLSLIFGLDYSTVKDDTILKYAEELVKNIEAVHRHVTAMKWRHQTL